MTNYPIREIVLDTKMTGLDPKKGHRLIAIACVELTNHRPTGRVYLQYINPGFLMTDEVVAINGITNEFLVDKPKFSKIADDFLDFIGSDPLIIHNANFDMNFIKSELRKCHRRQPQNKVIDTLPIARQKFPGQRVNLGALCELCHIDLNKIPNTGPLLDAQALAIIYRKMVCPTFGEKIIQLIKNIFFRRLFTK